MSNLTDFIGNDVSTITAIAGEAITKNDIVKITTLGNIFKENTATAETLKYKGKANSDIAIASSGDVKIFYTSPIKSIQRGVWTFGYNQDLNITITSVDMQKSEVIINNSSGYGGNTSGTEVSIITGGQLTTPTNLYLKSGRSSFSNSSGTCYWQVIEYN